jgi:hypothetical protein
MGTASPIASSIVRLLFCSGPSAILRSVVAVHIDPVDGVLARWRALHIAEKCLVALKPFSTHLYSSFAVIPVRLVGLGIAARFHVHPRSILFRRLVALSMSSLRCAATFFSKTSAAFCVAAFQRTSVRNNFIAAIASALPSQKSAARAGAGLLRHEQPAEPTSNQINLFHRGLVYGI